MAQLIIVKFDSDNQPHILLCRRDKTTNNVVTARSPLARWGFSVSGTWEEARATFSENLGHRKSLIERLCKKVAGKEVNGEIPVNERAPGCFVQLHSHANDESFSNELKCIGKNVYTVFLNESEENWIPSSSNSWDNDRIDPLQDRFLRGRLCQNAFMWYPLLGLQEYIRNYVSSDQLTILSQNPRTLTNERRREKNRIERTRLVDTPYAMESYVAKDLRRYNEEINVIVNSEKNRRMQAITAPTATIDTQLDCAFSQLSLTELKAEQSSSSHLSDSEEIETKEDDLRTSSQPLDQSHLPTSPSHETQLPVDTQPPTPPTQSPSITQPSQRKPYFAPEIWRQIMEYQPDIVTAREVDQWGDLFQVDNIHEFINEHW
jgi:hypothetical protein